ncbi:MAG: hypothetical protein RI560_08345 [Natronomonas sp.]|nr:hypothetical protein [Natronomonas sp.]
MGPHGLFALGECIRIPRCALREYEDFDVQQTTLGVDSDEFAVIEDRPEGVAGRVRIEGDDGVLAIPDGDGWALPGGVVTADPTRETVATFAEEWTGVECAIDGLECVSLVCLQCDPSAEELWAVSAEFSATATGESPENGVVWCDRSVQIAAPSAP